MNAKDLRIIFMGTPAFAVASLQRLYEHEYNISAVVTTPDKAAGRGLQQQTSAVKQFALEHKLTLLQPDKLNDTTFLETINQLQPHVIIVVAFRKLPDELINTASMACFNLHASLLPQYRGAAPINRALINGEKESGLTSFLLNDKIDCGKIILQQKISIPPHFNASMLHDHMMIEEAKLVEDTLEMIASGKMKPVSQTQLRLKDGILHSAPKIFRSDCEINWHKPALEIHNHIRGLSYKPGAFTTLQNDEGKRLFLKILTSEYHIIQHSFPIAHIESDYKKFLRIYTSDGYINIVEMQPEGKKMMKTDEFLRGFRLETYHIHGIFS